MLRYLIYKPFLWITQLFFLILLLVLHLDLTTSDLRLLSSGKKIVVELLKTVGMLQRGWICYLKLMLMVLIFKGGVGE